MERTLTTKSIRLLELSQWTAATALVAAGTLALFSAATLEKLSSNGDVAIDLQAFRRLGATSITLGRVDEEKLVTEEVRLIESAAFAAKDKLPAVRTSFAKIRAISRKNLAPPKVVVSTHYEAEPASPSRDRILSGTPVVLSSADADEIAQLEKITDATLDSQALARVYRNLRFQFVIAVDELESKEYPAESIAIARSAKAYEYDEVPELNEELYALSPDTEIENDIQTSQIETAPAKAGNEQVATLETDDSIKISASSSSAAPVIQSQNKLTADAGVRVEAFAVDAQKSSTQSETGLITSNGLDPVPLPLSVSPAKEVDSHPVILTNHESKVKQSTGPPEVEKRTEKVIFSPSLSSRSEDMDEFVHVEALPEPIQPKKKEDIGSQASEYSSDLVEYSKDVSAAYQGQPDETLSDYSKGSLEDSIADGDFSARPSEVVKKSEMSRPAYPNAGRLARTEKRVPDQGDFGNGVHRDEKGITINWDEDESENRKYSELKHGGKVFVGKPGQEASVNAAEIQKSLKKFSFTAPEKKEIGKTKALRTTQSSAFFSEPVIEAKKCETARIGVEAFNSGAEKEALSICRRELSLEGSREGTQARWWESYENETEHWPTLSYLKPGEASPTNRTPLLSTASIRILSAISKTNTHTGTGILFGEVIKGLEIQLLGRSDSPIYLDAGMKVRDSSADALGTRQFVFLNVEPGQPLLIVRNRDRNISGAIPLIVKSGMATHLKINTPKEVDLDLTVFDASSAKESRLGNLTAEVIGQPGKMGITDRTGNLKIRKVVVFDEFPVYLDVLKNEKTYKNRYRIRPNGTPASSTALYFFDEKRVNAWLGQLAGGLSPYSGLIAGVAPSSVFSKDKNDARHLKIGILEKKSSLVPERYLLDEKDLLVSDSVIRHGRSRYIGVQIPEGPAIPTVIDEKGKMLWSELVYAQPGVINVVSPDL